MHPLDNPVWQSLNTRQAGAGDAPAALVYTHYFRPRTPDMGRYIGIDINLRSLKRLSNDGGLP